LTDVAHEPENPDAPRARAAFRTTRWSVVAAAGGKDSGAARQALAVLCESYWYPVYVFVRSTGHAAPEAEDLTQGFFARLLEKRDLRSADPARGRFRFFLLGSVRHFVANAEARERAVKRGGGRAPLSIDFHDADRRYRMDVVDPTNPEKLFLRNWAVALVARATERLAEEYGARGKRSVFERLRPMLAGESPAGSRRELAERLGTTENALNVAVHRLRREFRRALRDEVAETLSDPAEAENELRTLMAALSEPL